MLIFLSGSASRVPASRILKENIGLDDIIAE
jgi:hypothetical protein